MTLNDPLANVLSHIMNCERLGRAEAVVAPASRMVREMLRIMHEARYIGEQLEIKDNKANLLKVSLLGKINKCGVVKPRYSVGKATFEKFEKRFLPAKDFGILIVSTPQGIMAHKEAKARQIGGRLIAYCY